MCVCKCTHVCFFVSLWKISARTDSNPWTNSWRIPTWMRGGDAEGRPSVQKGSSQDAGFVTERKCWLERQQRQNAWAVKQKNASFHCSHTEIPVFPVGGGAKLKGEKRPLNCWSRLDWTSTLWLAPGGGGGGDVGEIPAVPSAQGTVGPDEGQWSSSALDSTPAERLEVDTECSSLSLQRRKWRLQNSSGSDRHFLPSLRPRTCPSDVVPSDVVPTSANLGPTPKHETDYRILHHYTERRFRVVTVPIY